MKKLVILLVVLCFLVSCKTTGFAPVDQKVECTPENLYFGVLDNVIDTVMLQTGVSEITNKCLEFYDFWFLEHIEVIRETCEQRVRDKCSNADFLLSLSDMKVDMCDEIKNYDNICDVYLSAKECQRSKDCEGDFCCNCYLNIRGIPTVMKTFTAHKTENNNAAQNCVSACSQFTAGRYGAEGSIAANKILSKDQVCAPRCPSRSNVFPITVVSDQGEEFDTILCCPEGSYYSKTFKTCVKQKPVCCVCAGDTDIKGDFTNLNDCNNSFCNTFFGSGFSAHPEDPSNWACNQQQCPIQVEGR